MVSVMETPILANLMMLADSNVVRFNDTETVARMKVYCQKSHNDMEKKYCYQHG